MLLERSFYMEEYIIGSDSAAVTPLFVGREACEPSHSYGPYVRDYHIVHFCLSGRGVLKNKHGSFTVGEGQLFIIRKGEITTYTADAMCPWEYAWIAFRTEREYFGDECSVFDTPTGLDEKLTSIIGTDTLSSESCLSVIYDLIYHLSHRRESDGENDKVRSVRRYIRYNYMRKITVSSLAESFGFDRSYLYRIFKKRYGIGIKEYIIKVRLEKGKELLKEGFSVKESAHLVGYDDEFNFSKVFKKEYGVAPSRVRG